MEDDDLPLIFDSGATVSITPRADDFESWEPPTDGITLQGIQEQARVAGIGQVRWKVKDDKGQEQVIRTRAYHVPQTHVQLFSPRQYLQQRENLDGNGEFVVNKKGEYF